MIEKTVAKLTSTTLCEQNKVFVRKSFCADMKKYMNSYYLQ